MLMRLLPAALWLVLGLQANAQSRVVSKGALAEKIYLQTDGELYTNDQTIWYKAIVVNAANHRPSRLSGVLYVELIGANALISDRKIIKLQDGIGTGYFQLDESLKPGAYMLRAYTEWNKNFDADFHFTKYIDIYAQADKATADPFGEINLIEQGGSYSVQVELNPLLIDSLHSAVLSGTLNFDGGKDTISIEPSDNGDYTLRYQLPENTDLLAINFQTENGKSFSKTIVTNPDALDLQFFPEGGELVHGLTSKVGFKAVSVTGKGVEVSGDILDEQDNVVAGFKSNPLGMGYFALLPDSSKTYYARLKSRIQNDLILKYELPKTNSEGVILSVSQRRGNLLLGVASNTLAGDSVFVRSTSRGVRYYDAQGCISAEGQLQFLLPVKELPEGIIVFTLYDNKGVALAERLYFNQSGQKRLNISVSSDKADFQQRQESEITATVTDQAGNPVRASVSYLVVNKRELGAQQQQRQNLVSQLLLSSELKGEIEKPGYYFQPEKDRRKELDALMLTQGWRKYAFTPSPGISTISNMKFQPEYSLTVAGTISSLINRNKKIEGVDLTMMTFNSSTPDIYKASTDSAGRFYFDLNDAFGQRMNMTIQTANAKGKNKNYQVSLDKNESPEVAFDHRTQITAPDTLMKVLVEKHRERKLIEDAYRPASDIRDLGEFVVEDYAMTPQRRKVMKVHGRPDVVIAGKSIQAKNKKWSYGLGSVLFRDFKEHLEFTRSASSGIPYIRPHVRGANMTLVTVDGVPVELGDYAFVFLMPVSEVKSFEILKQPSNFPRLFYEVYDPRVQLPFYPAIIAIYTHAGKGILSVKKADGIFLGSIEMFSPAREFYVPKYDKLKAADWVKPDYRALVHWQPLVSTDATGKATSSFYNADHLGEMLVVVEAIGEDGSIGYQEFTYQVVKNTGRD
ncbi:MAG: TonB-dependent receptor plug domain-containing protein [Roseivirga sp.]